MFATDLLSELKFVLEFNLPKEVSDNQEHIKLSVHHVNAPVVKIPVCPIGCKPRPIRSSGEIHCLERYKYIKDVLPLINRWVNSISKLNNSRSNQFAEAKLYAYKQDGSLFKKWRLVEFHPLFNPVTEFFYDDIAKLIFKFENVIEEDFGLKVILNSIEKNRIRKISKTDIGKNYKSSQQNLYKECSVGIKVKG